MPKKFLYVFIDEGGNFDFSPTGTKYFSISTVTREKPFPWDVPLTNLKYQLIENESGHYLPGEVIPHYFHATEDKQVVRDKFFEIIVKSLGSFRIDSVIVEKRKTGPSLRPQERFYPRMLGYLLRHLFTSSSVKGYDEVIVITDQIRLARRKDAITKAIKDGLAILPGHVAYRIFHHPSHSCLGLQVVDYVNWAILRKWESGDARSYEIIKKGIFSEFDIFQIGTTYYY